MKREIRKGRNRAKSDVANALESLFVAETLSPAREIWIVAPWISDVKLIDNRAGRFAHLSALGERFLKISEILIYLAQRGTKVTVVISDDRYAQDFRVECPRAFEEKNLKNSLNFVIRPSEELHEKSIVTHEWQVGGSMNFTKQGIDIRDEVVSIETDPKVIATTIVDLRTRFPWPVEDTDD